MKKKNVEEEVEEQERRKERTGEEEDEQEQDEHEKEGERRRVGGERQALRTLTPASALPPQPCGFPASNPDLSLAG